MTASDRDAMRTRLQARWLIAVAERDVPTMRRLMAISRGLAMLETFSFG